ncbi:MAG: hypothetical protein JNK02_05285 [Planctomycetes bacterium]|nr:hypothetical protein [Planctomycetota bacterium]
MRSRADGLSAGRARAEADAAAPRGRATERSGSTRLGTAGDDGARARGSADATRSRTPEASGRVRAREVDQRGASTTSERVREALRRDGELARSNPEVSARQRAATRAAHAAGAVGTGVIIGTCGTVYGGGGTTPSCWDPYGDVWGGTGWYWNTCWTGGWWWGFGYGWPYGSCWWGWPSYWSCYWPWGYGWSTWGWYSSPWIYSGVVYVDSTPEVVVIREEAPAPAVEPAAAPAPAGAPPQVAPEIRAGLESSADESLAAGDTAFREGRYSDAVRHYARAVEFAPERGSLWLILSDALFATGDYHYAAYALRKSLELDATLLEPLVDKHEWYGDPAEFDRHIAWAEAYLRDRVLDEDARLVLAANYLFARRHASAVDALESAFGAGLVETKAGRLVLERARRALGSAPR